MFRTIKLLLSDHDPGVRVKIFRIYGFLLSANLAAWTWALVAFHYRPALLATALLAYGLGLRHAVDADHIAAIDNVTRKLMQENKRPVTVGLFFSAGHALVLLIGTAIVAIMAMSLQNSFASYNDIAGVVATIISGSFLLAMAIINLVVAWGVYKTYRHVRRGGEYDDESLNILLNNRGIISRILRPLIRLVDQSWQMLPVGSLFGLGFDTITEVSLLAVAATEASKGVSIWSIFAFPLLFSAGMSLIDTTDGILMLGAYGWAFVKPIRKLYYNVTITIVSAAVAILIGGIETLGLIAGEFNLKSGFWAWMRDLNDHFDMLGYCIIGIFAVAWMVSVAVYRAKQLDNLKLLAPSERRPLDV